MKTLLGSKVRVLTNQNAVQRGYLSDTIYSGELLREVDWMIGCPVFKCDIDGMQNLGLYYECEILDNEDNNS